MKSAFSVGAWTSAILLLLPMMTFAQDVTNDVEVIDSVTIIGKRVDIADVPGSAHVISSEELAEFAQSDVLRVLRAVPGVYVQEEDGYGLKPNIGIRGSGLDRSSGTLCRLFRVLFSHAATHERRRGFERPGIGCRRPAYHRRRHEHDFNTHS